MQVADIDKLSSTTEIAKNIITLHHGLYKIVRMPFALHNAPNTFQLITDVILSAVRRHFTLVNLVDIIIFLQNADDQILQFHTILSVLDRAGVALNFKKLKYFVNKIHHFRHVIQQGKLDLPDHTVF